MHQLNVPKKYTAAGQIWVNLVLLLLAAIFAFMPIASLDMSDNALWSGVQNAAGLLGEISPDFEDLEQPEDDIGITALKIVTSVSIIVKVVDVLISKSQESDKTGEKLEDLEKILATEEGKEAVIMTFAIIAQFIDSEEDEASGMSGKGSVAKIVDIIVKVLVVLILLAEIVILPLMLLFWTISNIIKALKNGATPDKVSGKVSNDMMSLFPIALFFMFILTFLPGFVTGIGIEVILICSIISIVVNVVISRLRAYNSVDFKYVNVVQGVAVLQCIGFAVFFVNLVKTKLLYAFFESLGEYVTKALIEIDLVKTQLESANYKGNMPTLGLSFLPDIIIMMAFFFLCISALAYAASVATDRITLTSKMKPKKSTPYTAAIIVIITSILPRIAGKLENAMSWTASGKSWTSESVGTIFELSADHIAALDGMFIGGIIMLVAAIVFSILRKVICSDIGEENEYEVLSGRAAEYGKSSETTENN